jgi:ATP-dependent protease ClpP protease subunit
MAHRLIVGDDLVLYGDVGDMWGDGSGFTGRDVIEALAEIGPGDVTVRLNSGGGYVYEGTSIYNALRAHPGEVTVYVDAIAASAASVIALAGDRIVMRSGAMIMIHDPSGMTLGTADDHRGTADTLDKMAGIIAGIYAERTGHSAEEIRSLMLKETWLDADEAVEFGFATEKDEAGAEAVARFDYAIYANAPKEILRGAQRARPAVSAAAAAHMEANTMANAQNPVAAEVTNAIIEPVAAAPAKPEAAKDVTKDIMAVCRTAKLSLDETMEIVEAVGTGEKAVEKAKDMIINRVADREPQPASKPARIEVMADARDRFKEGATLGLMGRYGMAGGERNEFASMRLDAMAREFLNVSGQKVPGDVMALAGAALNPSMSGMHSTSDFVEILANVANKSMLRGWEEAEETFQLWTNTGNATDFRPQKRIDLNLFPALSEVPEGAEYSYGTIGDRGEQVQIATFGKMFAITRQAIVNDDASVLTRIPMRMGRAARRTIGNLVYAVLTSNPVMSDTYALFSAEHNNISGAAAAPSVETIDAIRSKMARQSDPDGHAKGGLNIRPAFLIVPPEYEGVARLMMNAEFDPNKTQRTPNIVRGMGEVVADARIPAAEWYGAASNTAHDTIEVTYLNGVQTPVMEQRPGWNVDGVEFKVRIDAGVTPLDFRGLYRNKA